MSADQGNYECLHAKPENNSLKITLLDFQVKDVWLQILKYTNVIFQYCWHTKYELAGGH